MEVSEVRSGTTATGHEQHDPIHPEAFAWLLDHLDDDEHQEFMVGLRPIAHGFIDAVFQEHPSDADFQAVAGEFAGYLNDWILSVQLASHATWAEDVKKAEFAWVKGDRDTVPLEEIRSLVS